MMTVHVQRLTPSPWVEAFLTRVPAGSTRTVLDIACGSGRHIAIARERGYRVLGVDRDVAKARNCCAQLDNELGVELLETDLETGSPWPLTGQTFDVVIVTNYLHRPHLPDLVANVAPDGLLIYETFAIGQAQYGRPSNLQFLLRPGELLSVVAGHLTPFAFEHRLLTSPDRIVQRIAAVGPSHPWHAAPPSNLVRP
jgi:SAM-dependent methyltransferase